jgi:hypothetical protein
MVIVIAGVALAISQQDHNQNKLLSRLHSDEWKQRAEAVQRLIAKPETLASDQVKNALIDLLDRENQVIVSAYQEGQPVSVKYGEAYSEYYAELLGAVDQVADFNDKRTLDVLVRASYNPDSQFAMKFARYGEAAAPALLEIASSDFAPHRENALAILGEILKRAKDPTSRIPADVQEGIKQALINGTNDAEPWVRSQAVRSIGKVGDRDLIPLLERIAKTDPATIPAAEPGTKKFPVRAEALKALSAIKSKEPNRQM